MANFGALLAHAVRQEHIFREGHICLQRVTKGMWLLTIACFRILQIH